MQPVVQQQKELRWRLLGRTWQQRCPQRWLALRTIQLELLTDPVRSQHLLETWSEASTWWLLCVHPTCGVALSMLQFGASHESEDNRLCSLDAALSFVGVEQRLAWTDIQCLPATLVKSIHAWKNAWKTHKKGRRRRKRLSLMSFTKRVHRVACWQPAERTGADFAHCWKGTCEKFEKKLSSWHWLVSQTLSKQKQKNVSRAMSPLPTVSCADIEHGVGCPVWVSRCEQMDMDHISAKFAMGKQWTCHSAS